MTSPKTTKPAPEVEANPEAEVEAVSYRHPTEVRDAGARIVASFEVNMGGKEMRVSVVGPAGGGVAVLQMIHGIAIAVDLDIETANAG